MKPLLLALMIIVGTGLCLPLCAQDSSLEVVQLEAGYISRCQFLSDPLDPAYGCINNTFGIPTWVVPRENAMAMLGLLMAADILGDPTYVDKARLAADYLVRVQDTDGAWYNQYSFSTPGDQADPGNSEALAKSPTQTAEVMIALFRVGYEEKYTAAMRKGAQYLIACQKNGGNGLLLGGGKNADGTWRNWRWASDNAYAYQALKAAELWALVQGDFRFALFCSSAGRRIIKGINQYLYIKDRNDPDYGVWRRVVDGNNQPVDAQVYDWINYAPQMLDLPCRGVGNPLVGDWIHNRLQDASGACVWDNGAYRTRRSPGYSFQAVLCWLDLGQTGYARQALDWAMASGLWTTALSCDEAVGGWVDWQDSETGENAPCWQRFIDTSFYAIAAYNKGYSFSSLPAWLRVSYQKRAFCLQFQFPDSATD